MLPCSPWPKRQLEELKKEGVRKEEGGREGEGRADTGPITYAFTTWKVTVELFIQYLVSRVAMAVSLSTLSLSLFLSFCPPPHSGWKI